MRRFEIADTLVVDDAILDGEIIAADESGRPALVCQRAFRTLVRAFAFVFAETADRPERGRLVGCNEEAADCSGSVICGWRG